MAKHSKQLSYSSKNTRPARQVHARGEREFRTYDTSAIQPKRSKGPVVGTIVLVVVALLIVGFVLTRVSACFGGNSQAEYNLAQAGSEINITIPEGSSTNDIAELLGASGLIERSKDFVDEVKQQNAEASLKPGTYTITAGTSVAEIVSTLETGPEAFGGLTIPEGYRLDQIAAEVESYTNGKISANDFLTAAGDASKYAGSFSFLSEAGTNSLEGYLFPKTYQVNEQTTADSLIRDMLSQYQQDTASLNYSYPQSQGLNRYQTLILASIIEKESDTSNRAMVASVFYNRLAQDMPLQSDATVAYLIKDDPKPEDLEIDSPYNTYLQRGLPAGPICSPSLECLQAACNPATSDYLYFYFAPDANGKMVYSFSETYDEHQDAIAAS